MAQAAETLTPVSLELGGKDPMIVLSDADIERAANAAVSYGLNNSGQVCISVERIYVEAAIHDEFVDRLVAKVEALRRVRPASSAASTSARSSSRPSRADRRPRPRCGRSRCRAEDRRPDRRRTGSLLRADGADRGRPLDALHDRGDVRADPAGDEGRRRRGGRRPGQRGQLRPPGIGLDPRHRSRRGDRPADRGGGRVRQRRAAELRGAGAADGGLEAVRARLPPRRRGDPQVHAPAVAPRDARLRARPRGPHVPLRRRGHRAGLRGALRVCRQRALRRRPAGDAGGALRHLGAVARPARRRGPDRLLGALGERLLGADGGRAGPPAIGGAGRAARRARRPPRRPRGRGHGGRGPAGDREAIVAAFMADPRRRPGSTPSAAPACRCITRCRTPAPESTRTGPGSAIPDRRRCRSRPRRSSGRSLRSFRTSRTWS